MSQYQLIWFPSGGGINFGGCEKILWRIWQYFSAERNDIISFYSSVIFLTIFNLFGLLPSRSCRRFWIYQGHWTRDWLAISLFCQDLLIVTKGRNPFLNALFLKFFLRCLNSCLLVFCFLKPPVTLSFYVLSPIWSVFSSSVSFYTSGFMA